MDKNEIKRKIEQIKELAEKLKAAGIQVDLCDQIIEEANELIEILSRNEEDELMQFRLMIVLIEKMKGLGDKVPLLDVFLELYITALNDSLYFIDNVLKKHGWLHNTCMIYCKLRYDREENSRKLGETDEVEIAKDGHDSAMNGVGFYQYEKYQDQFREQYKDYIHQLALDDLLKQAEKAKNGNGSSHGNDPAAGTSSTPPSPPSPPPTLDEFILWMLASLRERMSPEEWERFRQRLGEMFPPLPPN